MLFRSPAPPTDDKPSRWKDDERRGDKRDGRARHEDPDPRGERGRGVAERRAEHPADSVVPPGGSDSRGRAKDQREPTPPPPPATTAPDDRDVVAATAAAVPHEEGKKKTKGPKKSVKKGRKEDDGGPPALGATAGDRFNPEPPSTVLPDAPPPLQSPRKGPKKKALDKKIGRASCRERVSSPV